MSHHTCEKREKFIQSCGRKNHEGNISLGKPRCRWKDSNNMGLKETG
jgi:hypothetical protein